MTYSIIAYDHESGTYGVAIQSHWFNVGRDSPWLRFGVGAVLTQATTDPSYGWRGLDAMAEGIEPARALQNLLSDDPMADRRQVAMMDADGRISVHTGDACIPAASHVTGRGWAVLGNLLTGPSVIESMAESFPDATGTLAERMVRTLEAAEHAGGDVRGRQSAAIRVAPGVRELAERDEPGVDISIADHREPVVELRRLVEVDRAYRALRRGQRALDASDITEARTQFALASQLRHGVEVDFWRALGIARMGEIDEAARILESVFDARPRFAEVLARLGGLDKVAADLARRLDTRSSGS